MPIYSVQGPDGRVYDVEGPAGASERDILSFVAQNLGSLTPEPKKKEGIGASLAKGAESMISQTRTGLASLLGSPEEAAKAGLERGKDIGSRYADAADLEKVKKAYEERGVLPAAGEAISQVPGAIAEQTPNIAGTVAGAKAGQKLGSAFGPAGRVAGALAGAALPSLLQQFGGNIERQQAEGAPISTGRAAAAAVPQAALDVAGNLIPLGGRLVSKLTGIPEKALLAGGADATKLANETLLKTLAKGTAVGAAAEIPTEVAQQMLERAQAGLSLTSPDALKEYGETAYQVGLLGPMGAAGRFVDRGAAKQDIAQKQAEEKRLAQMEQLRQEEDARVAQEQQALAEEARKQTPEYARDFVKQYQDVEAQFAAAKAVTKPGKDATFEQLDEYKQAQAQKKELAKQLSSMVGEYRRVVPLVAAAEQKRAQELETAATAEIPQEAQQQQYFQSPQAALPGFENVEQPRQVVEEDKNAKALELAQQHKEIHDLLDDNQQAQSDAIARDDYDALDKALEQRGMLETELNKIQELLKETGHPIFQEQEAQRVSAKLEKAKAELKNMAGEALDPAKVLKKRAQIKELEAELQGYGGVQEALKPADAEDKRQLYIPMGGKSESRQAFSQRTYTPDRYRLGAEEQEQDVVEQQRLSEEEVRADAERERRIAPEVNALRRLGEGPALSANVGEGQISGDVDKLVDALLLSTMPATGRVVSGTTSTRPNEADVLRGQLQYARVTNNRALESQLKERMAQLKVAENEVEGGLDTGLTAKEVGVEGRLSPQAREANRIARIAQSQMATFDRLVDFIQYIRENDQNIPEARKQTLRNAAEKLKDTAIGLALNEAQARRKQAGVSPMTTAEQTKMVGELESIMTELIERGAGMFEPTQIVGQKAQMRANKIVMGATEEERRAPLGRRVFNNFEAAAQALREQMRDAINVQPEVKERKPLTPPRKVSEPLRMQFSGQQRDVDTQFDAAYDRSTDEEYKTLRDIRSKFMSLSPEAQDIALEQVRRVETGRGLDMPRQLTDELADLSQARVSDGDQNELFPGTSEKGVTRTTSKRFINFLDSKEVFKLREEIAEQNRQAEFQAKRAATIAAKVEEEAKKAEEFLQKVEASKNKSPIEKAQAALAKISGEDSQVQIAIKTADAIKRERLAVRQRINSMVEQVQSARNRAEKHLKEVQESFDYIAKQYLLKPKNVKFNIGLDHWEKELKKAEKQFASADKALNAAKATQLRVTEDHASDTINNALINEGEKAEREYQRAKDAVLKAKSDEIKAQNELERVRTEVAKEPRSPYIGELLERVPGDKALRYVRDTSEQGVQRAVKAMRGIIGKDEVAYDEAVVKGNMGEAKKIANRIEGHYEKINDILNNAPVKIEQRMSAAEAKAMREYEDAQAALLNAMNAEFRQKAGLPAPKLSSRKVAGVVKTNRGAIRTAIKEPSVAQQEREAKAAAEGPKPALEKIAEARAEEARLQAQIDYIAANPSKTKEGAAKQRAAKAEAVAQRAAIRAELKELSKEQAAIVSQAKQAKKETKQVRTKGKEFTRADTQAAKALEDVYSQGDMATETTSAQQDQLTDEAKDALRDGRLLDALDDVAINGATPFIRANAAALRKLVSRTRVFVTDDIEVDGVQVPAAFNSTHNVILIKPDALTEANLIHEATHAATIRGLEGPEDKLTADQLAAKRELEQMFEDLTADGTLSGEYAAKNVKEFASEVQSNANLRAKMDERSMLRKFFDAVLRFIGMQPSQVRSEKAQAIIERLYMQSGKLETKTLAVAQPKYANAGLSAAGDVADKLIAKQKGLIDTIRANSSGLAFETQLVDRFAGFERISRTIDSLKGAQMMYYLRMYDQRMNFVAQSVGNGALQIVEKKRADGQKEYVIESKAGPSLKGVVDILKDAPAGSPDAANRLFTMYLAAKRAERVGLDKLNFNGRVTQADLNQAMKAIESTPGLKENFERARLEYNQYNKGLINFLASTGAISKETAQRLSEANDYIPFYRERGGVAELMIGGEAPIRVGSIAEQPYLHELVGGDEPIIDFMTSSVQNTNILTDMGLRNLATKNAIFELANMDLAKITPSQKSGPNVVKFKVDGEDRYALIDTDKAGIPADILVKGMEGIPTQMPMALRVLGAPAQLLRKAVTLSPLYAAKQLFRDSLAAPILAGADFAPVLGALKEINAPSKQVLESRGITGGQVFTGTSEDLTRILREINSGKSNWAELVGKFETISMEADAVTRRAQYNSYIAQGLSEMEATLMSLESMNFNKRGASPSIHVIGAMIPFFNAQIQGLNVLYKALSGKMPFDERLRIQEKLLQRGMMLAAGTLAYTAMMQDDEAYKNAPPEQKYGNWFLRLPGVEEPLRIPVPFEIGYIFKALPEALYNSMVDEHGGEEAVKAFKQIILQTIPGGSSYGIPQALKPAIEAGLGKSFYTGRDILSAHEKNLLPEDQFRVNTSEIAKTVGKVAGVSPIVLEQLVQGYTGTMGLAFLQAVSMGVPASESPERAYKRLSEMPVFGGAFQPNDGGAIINRVYERMNEYKQVETTVKDLINRGERARALELVNERGNEFVAAQVSDSFTKTMGNLTKLENAIRASDLTPEQKREKLNDVRQAKISYAKMVEQASDKSTLP
jgi:hypothetical protein